MRRRAIDDELFIKACARGADKSRAAIEQRVRVCESQPRIPIAVASDGSSARRFTKDLHIGTYRIGGTRNANTLARYEMPR